MTGGPGDPTGASPYLVSFDGGALARTDPVQLLGSNGTTPLSGGMGTGANKASVTTTVPGGPGGTSQNTSPIDLAVGPNDEVFVAKEYPSDLSSCPDGSWAQAEVRIQELDSSGVVDSTTAPCGGFPALNEFDGNSPGFAVHPITGNPYAVFQRSSFDGAHVYIFGPRGLPPELSLGDPTNLTSTGATIAGAVTPHGPGAGYPPSSGTTYRVEYRKSSEASWHKYTPDISAGPGFTSVPFSIGVNGLAPKTAYEVKVTVVKPFTASVEETESFTTLAAPPAIGSPSASNVTLSSADLHARINPQGTATSYHFEYGPTTSYGQSTPETEIGEALEPQAVTDHVEGLQDTTYHFRAVATNALGTVTSPDQTFVFHPQTCPNQTLRQQTNAAYLPDCRAYELVSPEDAGGTVLSTGGPQSAYATSPSRLAFTGQFGEIPGAGRSPINTTGDLYVASRGATGWHSRYIGPSSSEAGCVGGRPIVSGTGLPTTIQNDVMADASLSRIIDWNLGNPLECVFGTGGGLSVSDYNTAAEGSNAPYVWNSQGEALGRWPTNLAGVSGASANFGCPQDPNLHPYPPGFRSNIPVPYFCSTSVTASGDLNHFVFSTASGLFGEGGLKAAPGSAYDNNTVTGTTTLISKLPNGEPIGQEQPKNGGPDELIQFPHVSTDGSRILMGTAVTPQCKQVTYPVGPGPGGGKICPVISQPTHLYMRVDNAVTYDVSGTAVHYVDSTPDGTKVYFTTAAPLAAADADESVDLYLWDEGASPRLSRVSVGGGPTGNADACGSTWTARCDVETYDDSAISNVIGNQGGLGGWADVDPNPGYTDNSVAEKSGDIYFYSPEQLDNGQGAPGAQNLYVYRKGAVHFVAALNDDAYCIGVGEEAFFPSRKEGCSNGALGRLQVTPDGRYAAFITTTRLTEYDNEGHAEMYRYDAETGEVRCMSCRPDNAPPSSEVLGSMGGRFITDDGRVFFDTEDALEPRDTNEGKDTYEYVDGHPQLITTGTGEGGRGIGFTSESVPGFYGVSADGTDAYFGSFETLVGQDRNGSALKFYDARVGGGFAFVPLPQPCAAADECHGSSSTPPGALPDGTGAALGSGGNHRATVKRKHRKHSKHRRAKHRKHGKKTKRQSGGRR